MGAALPRGRPSAAEKVGAGVMYVLKPRTFWRQDLVVDPHEAQLEQFEDARADAIPEQWPRHQLLRGPLRVHAHSSTLEELRVILSASEVSSDRFSLGFL